MEATSLTQMAVTRLRSDLLGKPRPACPCERRSEEPAGAGEERRTAKRTGIKEKKNEDGQGAADWVKGGGKVVPYA